MVQEVRYVCPSLNIAEVLTKTTKMKGMLQHLVQTGRYDLPGGFFVKDSTLTPVGTRYKTTRMEQHQEGSQGERWGKFNHFVSPTPIQSQTLEQSTGLKELEQNQHLTKEPQVTTVMKSSSNEKKSSIDTTQRYSRANLYHHIEASSK